MKAINERLSALRYELQEYHDNASKGGKDRKKYMRWLKEDIKKLEQKKELIEMVTERRERYGDHPASDRALMVLLLMSRYEEPNYCRALRQVLRTFPDTNRESLEKELDRFI